MKRFYKDVSTSKTEDGYNILLDGKPVKTPAQKSLLAPNHKIAALIVEEWEAQENDITPNTMPVMQICVTAQDYVTFNRSEMTPLLLRYLDTDLLCYQTDEPPQMAAHQEKHWTPWLAWFKKEIGISLSVKKDLSAHPITQKDYDILRQFIDDLDLQSFTVFQLLVSSLGSVILAIAFVKEALSPTEAFKLAKLEELFYVEFYKLEKHGTDPMQEKEFKVLNRDLAACAAYLKALSA